MLSFAQNVNFGMLTGGKLLEEIQGH